MMYAMIEENVRSKGPHLTQTRGGEADVREGFPVCVMFKPNLEE